MRAVLRTCLSLLAALVCQASLPASPLAQELAVGVFLPLSGSHAYFGHLQKNSMLLALEEVNRRGGIAGRHLQLDIRDTGGSPKDARAVVDHFARDKQYLLVLGGFSSRVTAAAANQCDRRKIPFLAITGSQDEITRPGSPYVFRVAPPRSLYGAPALDLAGNIRGIARVAIVAERSSYGEAMLASVKTAAGDRGWSVSGEFRYDPGETDMKKVLVPAASLNPQAVFLVSFPPEGSRLVAEVRRTLPGAVLFNLSPASTMASSYLECGEDCRGVLNPSLWVSTEDQASRKYADTYLARFGVEPDYHGAQAYAAVMVAAAALNRAHDGGTEKVRETLEGITVATPYGRVRFGNRDGYRNQNDPPGYLSQWTGSRFEVVWPRERATADLLLPGAR